MSTTIYEYVSTIKIMFIYYLCPAVDYLLSVRKVPSNQIQLFQRYKQTDKNLIKDFLV